MRSVLVFDLDDTLYAERDFVLSGFGAVDAWLRHERGVDGLAEAAWDIFLDGARGTIFDAALRQLGIEPAPALVRAMVAVYRAHEPGLALLPDARRTLAAWRRRARLGLITDGFAATQRRKIAALRLEKKIDEIICTDDFGRENWKPSAFAFEHLMQRLGCDGSDCVYVADNPTKDFVAPNRLGWLSVRIRRAGGEHAGSGADLPAEYQARHEIKSLDKLGDVLEQERDLAPVPV